MGTAKKVTEGNHKPGINDGRFRVYSKQFNDLVDVVNELEPADGTLVADTISESTSNAGVTVDGVLIKDSKVSATGGISINSKVSEFIVETTLTATEIVGSSAGDIGHANGATIVTAPGAGYAIELVSVTCIYDFDTAAYTGGANDLVVAYESGGATLTGVCTTAKLLGAAGDKIVTFFPLTAASMDLVANAGLSLRGTAYTQPGTAAGIIRVYAKYNLITTDL